MGHSDWCRIYQCFPIAPRVHHADGRMMGMGRKHETAYRGCMDVDIHDVAYYFSINEREMILYDWTGLNVLFSEILEE